MASERSKRKIYILHSADFGIATVGLIFCFTKKKILIFLILQTNDSILKNSHVFFYRWIFLLLILIKLQFSDCTGRNTK